MANYHFSGYATRNDLRCSDGRTILKDAFKSQNGQEVPLVWNHDHSDPTAVLGHAMLENREDGVYAYCTFNESENAQHVKEAVMHGDIRSMSIWANRLKQTRDNCVVHGNIKEVSLVYAGANPGAYIDSVMVHGDDNEENENLIINYDEHIMLYHSDDDEPVKEESEEEVEEKEEEPEKEETEEEETAEEAEESEDSEEDLEHADGESTGKSVKELFNSAMSKITEDEQTAVEIVVGMALEDTDDDEDEEVEHSEGGEETMKKNVFDQEEVKKGNALSHADQELIINLAKESGVGTLKKAMAIFAHENQLEHAESDGVGVFEDYGVLFPDLELLKKGEPETIYDYNNDWVAPALAKIHKMPYSRIRTRHADARLSELKAKGYQKKGDEKTVMGQIKMIKRETTPQTIYIKDSLHRDDIIDITDFSIVAYQWKQMRRALDETMILAAMIGDGRELEDPDKISEEHIRPIWKDNEEYTIHYDVDIEAARTALQGTDTNAHFGDNYIYAEAIITAALYSREKFKGTGTPDFYCTPHLVNVMLLARDLNGRRIYDSKADLAKALNCGSIVEVEHFEGLTRETEEGETKKLLGLFVNLHDYTFGSTRGGEITKFEDFDMDFNKEKFMLETRLSGSLYKLKSAIALEEPVTDVAG